MLKNTILIAISLSVAMCGALNAAAPQEARLWEPAEWKFQNAGHKGNPFDLVAKAYFTHRQSGRKIVTELFYTTGNTWTLRFTGTLTGQWQFTTQSSDSALNGRTGQINILPNPGVPGFITNFGGKWGRLGTNEAFSPQYVMYTSPDVFYNKPDRIDADVRTFLLDHGFSGVNIWVACRWFDLEKSRSGEIAASDPNPDPRTFDAIELLIKKVYAAGGVTHIWAWGDEQRRMTPKRWGLNGKIDQRLQRYICARLGPLPGWSMCYGWDLQEWVESKDLQTWHEHMHKHLGWHHYLGARAPDLEQIYTGLDYSSYQQHRPDYDIYVKAIEQFPDRPTFLEDRFRVRTGVYPKKDYDFEMTRRGLWRATMAGGAANIWGNLLAPRPDGMSHPYPNKDQIRTWSQFWKDRFKKEMIRDNSLTDGHCFGVPGKLLVFYKEDTESIAMNLAELPTALAAIAVDTRKAYKEIRLPRVEPRADERFKAPHRSDWAVAVQAKD